MHIESGDAVSMKFLSVSGFEEKYTYTGVYDISKSIGVDSEL